MAAGPLERIADHAQKIANMAMNMDYAIPGNIMEMIEKAAEATRQIVEDSMESLYNHDAELANKVIEREHALKPKIHNYYKSKDYYRKITFHVS
jgi:phosphate uptake regulator